MRTALAAPPTLTMTLSFTLALAACSQEAEAPVVDEPVDPATRSDDANLRAADRRLAGAAAEGDTPRQLSAIPERYRGVWDVLDGDCARTSEFRMEIGAGHLGFYEARGQVTRIVADGADAIVATMAMEGEGERWTLTRRFALAENDRLVPSPVGDEAGFEPITLKRCES